MEQASRLHNDKSRRARCTTGNDCHEDAPERKYLGAFVELVESLTDEANADKFPWHRQSVGQNE